LTNNFARRFVIGGSVINRDRHRYLQSEGAEKTRRPWSRNQRLNTGDKKMRKTILTILASALFAATTVQIAAAAEHHRGHKTDRAPTAASEQIRNSNAYAWPSPAAEPGWSRYEDGALSAPAGR
jgi:hypothetical protein